MESRSRLLKKIIQEYVPQKISKEIPTVAIDNTSFKTPDGQPWLGELYTTVLERVSSGGFLHYFMSTAPGVLGLEPLPFRNKPEITADKTQNHFHLCEPLSLGEKILLNDKQRDRIKNRFDEEGYNPSVIQKGIKIVSEVFESVDRGIKSIAKSAARSVKSIANFFGL